MRKIKLIYYLLFIISLYSCDKTNKNEYTFVLQVQKNNSDEIKNDLSYVFSAENDSLAYIRAYEKYCNSESQYYSDIMYFINMGLASPYDKPVSFKLKKYDNIDIADLKFQNQDSIKFQLEKY